MNNNSVSQDWSFDSKPKKKSKLYAFFVQPKQVYETLVNMATDTSTNKPGPDDWMRLSAPTDEHKFLEEKFVVH